MRLLPNYFKTLGEGPARGMERGEKDAHEVYRTTQSTLTSQSISTEFRPLRHLLLVPLSLSLCLCLCLCLSLSSPLFLNFPPPSPCRGDVQQGMTINDAPKEVLSNTLCHDGVQQYIKSMGSIASYNEGTKVQTLGANAVAGAWLAG